MPAAAIEPPKPTQPDPIAQFSIAGKSQADLYAEGTTAEPGQSPGSAAPPDFSDALKTAQAKDKGAPAPEPPKAPVKPADSTPPAAPKVPGLPQQTAPADDWQPKGQVAKHFDALKTKHAEEIGATKAEVERLRAELSAAKATGSPEDITAAKKQLEEYKAILKDVAIERDPEFKQKYSVQETAAREAAKMAAGDDGEKLDKLLSYPPSPWRNEQIDKLVDNLASSAQRRVNAALQNLERIDIERASEISTRRQSFEQKQALTQQQQREMDAARSKEMEDEFNKVSTEWSKPETGHPFFTERDGDIEHNQRVAQARLLAKHAMQGNLSRREIAEFAHWGATGPLALEGWKAEREARLAAEAQLDKMRGVSPGMGRSTSVEGEDSPKAAPAPGTPEYLRYMNAQLKAAQTKDFMAKRGVK